MLAQLKRDLRVGDKVQMIKMIHTIDGIPTEVAIRDKVAGIRTITLINTTGWYFANDEQMKAGNLGSWCEYPKSKDLHYFKEHNVFEIFDKEKNGIIWGVRTYKIIC